MATYVNDLRLKEIATGDESGTWGTSTNTNLELIGEALGYGTQDCFSSDADATTTVADGATDPARAMYFKVTSSATLTATRTLTIAPNTISRVMFIENATTGSQSINISQGSGANVTIATGKTAVVYLDGAGSGAAVVDAMALVDPGVTDTLAEVLTAGNTSGGTDIAVSAGDDITFTDTSKAIFGAGSDLQIYHDGSHSYIEDAAGTGNLKLRTNTLRIENAAGTELSALFVQDGAATLYNDNTARLATTSSGIDVTGSTVTDGLTSAVTDGSSFAGNFNHTGGSVGRNGIKITSSGTSGTTTLIEAIRNTTNTVFKVDGNGNLILNDQSGNQNFNFNVTGAATFNEQGADADFRVESNGNANMLFVDAGNDRVGIGQSSPATALDVLGTVTADGLTVDGDAVINDTIPQLQLMESDTTDLNSVLKTTAGQFRIQTINDAANSTTNRFIIDHSTGDISFYEDTGTTAQMVWDASADALTFKDSVKATFGTGSDLQIYHDASNSRIADAGTGVLVLQSDGTGVHINKGTTENMAIFNTDGSVELYYDNAKKLETTSTGIDVTGTVTSDGLTIDSGNTLRLNAASTNDFFTIIQGGTQAVLTADSDAAANMLFKTASAGVDKDRMLIAAGGDISFYEDTGTTAKLHWDSSAESLGIGTTSPDTILHLSKSGNSYPSLRFERDDTTVSSGNVVGRIEFEHQDATDAGVAARMLAEAEDASGSVGIAFETGTPTSITERMRIDSSGNLLVAKTSTSFDTVGSGILSTGEGQFVRDGGHPISANRKTSDGNLIYLAKDGTQVGSIATRAGNLTLGNAAAGLHFNDTSVAIYPENVSTGAATDGALGLGLSSARFKDFYLSGFISGGSSTGATTRAIASGGVTSINLQQARGSIGTPTTSVAGGDGNFITSEVYDGSAFNKIGQIGIVTGTSLDDGDIVFATAKAGTTSTKMTLDEDGNLLVGRTSRLTSQVESISSDTVVSAHGTLTSHQTNVAIMQYTSNEMILRSYGATAGTGEMVFKTGGGGGSTDSEAMRIDSSGNVGIGTNSPDSILHLSGSSSSKIIIEDPANPRQNYIGITGSDNLEIAADEDNLGSSSSIRFRVDASEKMRINSSGDVGIGTSSPGVKLEVLNSVDADLVMMIRGQDNTTEYMALGVNGANGVLTAGASGSESTNMVFRTASSGTEAERMRIDSSGNVGIGDTSPSTPLHVNSGTGNVAATFESTDAGSYINLVDNGSGTFGALIGAISDDIVFSPNNVEAVRIDSSGNLLVGTTSQINTSKTNILGTSTTNVLGLKTEDNNYLINGYSSTTEVLRVEGDGDILNQNNSYGAISDERLKSNIVDASSQLDDIMAVQVRSYTLNETGATHIGVVAQELEASGMSGLVAEDKEGMKSVKYSVLYMKALKALQEAVTRIETLEAKVAQLEGVN